MPVMPCSALMGAHTLVRTYMATPEYPVATRSAFAFFFFFFFFFFQFFFFINPDVDEL